MVLLPHLPTTTLKPFHTERIQGLLPTSTAQSSFKFRHTTLINMSFTCPPQNSARAMMISPICNYYMLKMNHWKHLILAIRLALLSSLQKVISWNETCGHQSRIGKLSTWPSPAIPGLQGNCVCMSSNVYLWINSEFELGQQPHNFLLKILVYSRSILHSSDLHIILKFFGCTCNHQMMSRGCFYAELGLVTFLESFCSLMIACVFSYIQPR